MFCVGDIVVYGAQGLCKVDGIGPLPMKFADKSKRYYTLHTCKQPSMTIYAPVDNQTVVMRQPLNRAQAENLILEMPQYAVVPILDAKGRESRCREALQTCDCREIAKMIRGCHNRNKGTAENERLRDPKFIFSYPKNERLIFLCGRNAAQKEISTMRVG